MRRLLLVAICACAPSREIAEWTLDVDASRCLTAAPGETLSLFARVSADAQIVVELGDFIVSRTAMVAGVQTQLSVPGERLARGENLLRIRAHAPSHTASNVVALSVYGSSGQRQGDSTADEDGDCFTPLQGDCNDHAAGVRPFVSEICDDAVDNDCDGKTDAEDALCACADRDADGFAAASCGGGDCDDDDPAASPTASELCDSRDNDCDGLFDEIFDGDNDGFVACDADVPVLRRKSGASCGDARVTCGDCDDADAEVRPGDGCPE